VTSSRPERPAHQEADGEFRGRRGAAGARDRLQDEVQELMYHNNRHHYRHNYRYNNRHNYTPYTAYTAYTHLRRLYNHIIIHLPAMYQGDHGSVPPRGGGVETIREAIGGPQPATERAHSAQEYAGKWIITMYHNNRHNYTPYTPYTAYTHYNT
jgi:hypothetical protein